MGSVVQQINLYRGYAAAASASDGARLMLYAGIGALLIVGVLVVETVLAATAVFGAGIVGSGAEAIEWF